METERPEEPTLGCKLGTTALFYAISFMFMVATLWIPNVDTGKFLIFLVKPELA